MIYHQVDSLLYKEKRQNWLCETKKPLRSKWLESFNNFLTTDEKVKEKSQLWVQDDVQTHTRSEEANQNQIGADTLNQK